MIRMYVYDLSLEQVPCLQLQWFLSYLHKTESSHVFFLLYKTFTSNNVPYSSRIYYCTTFQYSKVSGVTVAPAFQVRASSVLLLLTGCLRRTTLGWCEWCTARAERDGTRAETTFRLSPKRTSPFKSAGESVQSTAGSRGVRISGSNAGYNTFRGRVRVLATHSIRQFLLHFPSRASPCSTTFRTQYT